MREGTLELCPETVVMCLACGCYGAARVDRLARACDGRPRSVVASTRLARFLRGEHPLWPLRLSGSWPYA